MGIILIISIVLYLIYFLKRPIIYFGRSKNYIEKLGDCLSNASYVGIDEKVQKLKKEYLIIFIIESFLGYCMIFGAFIIDLLIILVSLIPVFFGFWILGYKEVNYLIIISITIVPICMLIYYLNKKKL